VKTKAQIAGQLGLVLVAVYAIFVAMAAAVVNG
jgi:hypothetical protein